MWIPAWFLRLPAHFPKGWSVWKPDYGQLFKANDSGNDVWRVTMVGSAWGGLPVA